MFQDETPRRLQSEIGSDSTTGQVAFVDAAEGMLDACGLGADELVEVPAAEPVAAAVPRPFPPPVSLN